MIFYFSLSFKLVLFEQRWMENSSRSSFQNFSVTALMRCENERVTWGVMFPSPPSDWSWLMTTDVDSTSSSSVSFTALLQWQCSYVPCCKLFDFFVYFLFPFCLDIIFSLGLTEWWIVRLKRTRTLFLYKHGFIFYFSADWKEQKFGNMDLLFQSFLFLLLSGSGSGRNLLWGRKKSRNGWLMNITHNHWNRIVLFFKIRIFLSDPELLSGSVSLHL